MACVREQVSADRFDGFKRGTLTLFLGLIAKILHVLHLGLRIARYIDQPVKSLACPKRLKYIPMKSASWRVNNSNDFTLSTLPEDDRWYYLFCLASVEFDFLAIDFVCI